MSYRYSACLALMSAMILACSFFGFEDKNHPMSSSVGILVNHSFSRGGDFSVILEDQDDHSYRKFIFLQFRSYLEGKVGSYKGKRVRIDHYDKLIANCWAGDDQFCFSKCASDQECRRAQNRSGAVWLRSLSAALALASVIALFWRRRIKRT